MTQRSRSQIKLEMTYSNEQRKQNKRTHKMRNLNAEKTDHSKQKVEAKLNQTHQRKISMLKSGETEDCKLST